MHDNGKQLDAMYFQDTHKINLHFRVDTFLEPNVDIHSDGHLNVHGRNHHELEYCVNRDEDNLKLDSKIKNIDL